ncbi:MAG: zinc-dependent metalloprotease [Chitinophagales bacterium]|nr:zinc-dependent metalloprotease [Chitinophagales bacterium]
MTPQSSLLRIFIVLILGIFSFHENLFAQPQTCLTSSPTFQEKLPNNYNPESGCYPVVTGPFYIRIYVHVIRAAPNGSGGQSDVAIKQAIDKMRTHFAPHNIFFVWDDCDINVIIDNALYTATAPDLNSLLTNYGNTNGINLFFFPTEEGMGNFAIGKAIISGKALYIGGEKVQWDGSIIPAIESQTLSHEMGHCLGLYHTFEQLPDRFPNNNIFCCAAPGGERADGSNGCECGDYVQDTPAFPNKAENGVNYPACQFNTNLTDCDNDPYNPDEANLMNYSNLLCQNSFTEGQGERMRWAISEGGIDPNASTLSGILANGIFFQNVNIVNTVTWDLNNIPSGIVTIYQALTIHPGASLHISPGITVQFAKNAALHINPNGLLDLDGKLTSLCSSYWQGVYVWGDCSKGQQPTNGVYAQGRFVGKSNGTIENALMAVRNFGPGTSEAGGQIKCTGTTFKNNHLGVVFRRYMNRTLLNANGCIPPGGIKDDVSILDRCTFETNNAYPVDLSPFSAFVDLNEVRGIKIFGCNFTNLKTQVDCSGSLGSDCYGYGVKSFFAGFKMNNSLSGPGITKFKGLSFGVHAVKAALTRAVTINGAEFTDCYKGIYASQAVGIDISSCKFFMGKVPNPLVRDRQFGTIINQTSTYKYRGNKSYGPAVNVEKTIGTCINDCGDLNNVVFQNRYEDVMIGNVATLVNAGGPMPRGLLYECNTNIDVYGFDFTQPALGDMVRNIQGIVPASGFDPIRAAGNKFSYNPNFMESDFSYHGGGNLDYRYLPDNPNVPGDEAQEPLDFVGLFKTNAPPNLTCGSWFEGEPPLLTGTALQTEKNRYYLNRPAYITAAAQYQNALASGNTTLTAYYRERAAYHRAEMDESAGNVLYALMRDTIAATRDSIRQWTLNLETFGADLDVVIDDLISGEPAKAQAVYSAIPGRFTLSVAQQNDWMLFGQIKSILSTQEIGFIDEPAQQTLQGIAQQSSGIAGRTAQSILQVQGFSFESAECGLPECCAFSERGRERDGRQGAPIYALKVYPNPAQTSVTFEWPDQSSPAQISIFDMTGRLVWTQTFHQKTVWEAADEPGGMYFYTVSSEGALLTTGKIFLIK